MLWPCIFTLMHGLNHASPAIEDTHQSEEYMVIDELVVNNRNNYKTIIYKNEEEGISEMRKLIESSQMEECWIYLPQQQKWIEIGYSEESEKKINDRYITKSTLDVRFLDRLMNENNNMILYHFHPSYCLSLEEKINEQKEKGSPMNENEIERERIRFLIKSAYPSTSDLMSMIVNTLEFFEKNPDGIFTFKICSHYGITEYQLTEEGKAHFYIPACPAGRDNTFRQIARIANTSSSANLEANVRGEILELNPRQTMNPLSRIKMNPNQKRNSLSRIKEIEPMFRAEKSVEAMNNNHLRVTFTPYEQIPSAD